MAAGRQHPVIQPQERSHADRPDHDRRPGILPAAPVLVAIWRRRVPQARQRADRRRPGARHPDRARVPHRRPADAGQPVRARQPVRPPAGQPAMMYVLFLVLPETLLLDLVGPAEALRLANQQLAARGQAPAFRLRYVCAQPEVMTSIGLQLSGLEPLPSELPDGAWVVL